MARRAAPVEDFITRLVVGPLSRPDAADLVVAAEGGPDVGALREEAAAIRRNLEEMAADRGSGVIGPGDVVAIPTEIEREWDASRLWSGGRVPFRGDGFDDSQCLVRDLSSLQIPWNDPRDRERPGGLDKQGCAAAFGSAGSRWPPT